MVKLGCLCRHQSCSLASNQKICLPSKISFAYETIPSALTWKLTMKGLLAFSPKDPKEVEVQEE